MREATHTKLQVPFTASSFLKYHTVDGYFVQDDPKTDPLTFDYVRRPCDCSPLFTKLYLTLADTRRNQTTTNFGLIDRAYESDSFTREDHGLTQWQRFKQEL